MFHLKYRPQKMADLDSVAVATTLKKIVGSKDMPQAFLFTGPKGAGKTSAARILARAVNCQQPAGGEPCGECDNCREIMSGRSMDVLEIDAASNRGIDDARSLRDKAVLLPSNLRVKVFIIDEVHMLTKEAFNALLKLIEEPPKQTIFVLCTTDVNKIPETVLSRLVRVDFRRGGKEELLKALKRVVEGEKIEIEEAALKLIVDKSDGSFRNIHRLFNEIVLSLGRKIGVPEIVEFLATKAGGYSEVDFENDLFDGGAGAVMEKLEAMAMVGADFSDFREKLISYFHQKLLGCYGIGEVGQSKFSKLELKKLIDLLVRAGEVEKLAVVDQLPLELVVVEFGGDKKVGHGAKKVEEPVEVSSKTVEVSGPVTLEEIEKQWGNILQAVKPFNHSVEAFLRAARPSKVSGGALMLEVFYPFHKDRLEEERNRRVVEEGLEKVLGVKLRVGCELGKSRKPPLVVKNETPISQVVSGETDIYEVAKEIFG